MIDRSSSASAARARAQQAWESRLGQSEAVFQEYHVAASVEGLDIGARRGRCERRRLLSHLVQEEEQYDKVRQYSNVAIVRMQLLESSKNLSDSATRSCNLQSALTLTTSRGFNTVKYSALPNEPDMALDSTEGCCGLLCGAGGKGVLIIRPMHIAERKEIK